MIAQPVLPVVTPDNRILGVIRISPPTTFTGQENSLDIDGKTVATRLVSYTRADGVYVEYLAAAITFSEERANIQQQLPRYNETAEHVVIDGWIQPGTVRQAPHRTTSALEDMLSKIEYFRSN